MCVCVYVLNRFSPVGLLATLCTVHHQAPRSMEFSRREYRSGLPCPPPGALPDPGLEPESPVSPALASRFFTTSATLEAPYVCVHLLNTYLYYLYYLSRKGRGIRDQIVNIR